MFSKNLKESTTGYFGKLPEFNDFIKFNAGSNEILFVDTWLQEGLALTKLKFKPDWKSKYENLIPTNFFIPVPKSENIVTGIMYASKDKSGREFPFVIFSLFPVKDFDKLYLIPAEFENNLVTLDAILREEENLVSLNTALKSNISVLPTQDSTNMDFDQYLSNTRINEFLSRTELDYSMFNLDNLTYNDSSLLRILFVSDKEHFGFDAGFLIRIYEKKINLNTKHSSVFWNNNDDRFQMIIFPFKLTVEGFTDLLSLHRNDNRIINIGPALKDYNPDKENTLSKFSEDDYSLKKILEFF